MEASVLRSVRVRLTLWYLLVFGVLLAGFSLAIYLKLSRDLYSRLDRSLLNAARTAAASFQTETSEKGGNARAGAAEALVEMRFPESYIAIYQGSSPLASNYPEGEHPVIPVDLSYVKQSSTPIFDSVPGFGGDGARQVLLPVKAGRGDYMVLATEPLHDFAEQLESMRRVFYLGLPAALAVAGIGGFLLARKSLAPVVAMSNQAERIGASNLHERLTVGDSADELSHLARVFNELLSRLDRSFESMKAFTADASHELRTPLSIIRGEADVALSQDREALEYRESLAVIQDEARRLSRLVDDMLELARADAGQRSLRIQEFYMNDLIDDCARAVQSLSLKKGIRIDLRPSSDLPFCGDEDLLRRMILNLLDNAIKYTPDAGVVTIETVQESGSIKIAISDTGAGIPAEAAPQIFDRFFRVSQSRSRIEGGAGLGLAIAKWAAEAHGGNISFVSNAGAGSTFTVTLPSDTRTA